MVLFATATVPSGRGELQNTHQHVCPRLIADHMREHTSPFAGPLCPGQLLGSCFFVVFFGASCVLTVSTLSLQLAYCVVQFMEKDATVTEYVRLIFIA